MSYKGKWELLFEDKRFREKTPPIKWDGRNPFENDYGRLISSAPIRRLQDKTQVFPLEQSDFIRTRLTHSLEVSYIGSSLAQSIEKHLIESGEIDGKYTGYLPSLLRVAGLVHDLGNPPFGHFGEKAIQNFFEKYFKAHTKSSLSEIQRNDLKKFDGNVQNLRILSKLNYFGDSLGYNLTYSSLASIIKYPTNSNDGNRGSESEEIAKKKFGYFDSEKTTYLTINDHLKLNNRRHPAVYIMEAADDIAYSAADIEDGEKLGIINLDLIEEIFSENLISNRDNVLIRLSELKREFGSKKGQNQNSLIVQKFRIYTQQLMIEAVFEMFKEKYDEIMKGTLENELIEISRASDIRQAYKKLQYLVFDDHDIVKKEIAGWEAIYGLLEIFVSAAESKNFSKEGKNSYEKRLYNIISNSYRYVYENIEQHENAEYKKLLLIVDFISGMTDSYAINLFQELKGIKI